VTGLVNQELHLQSEYLAAENRILRAKAGMSVQTHTGLFRQNRSGDLRSRFQQVSRLGVPVLPGSGNSLHHVLRRRPAPAFREKPEVFVIFQPVAGGNPAKKATADVLHQRSSLAHPVADESGVVVFIPDFSLAAYTPDVKDRWDLALGPFQNFYGMASPQIMAGELLVLVCDQQSDEPTAWFFFKYAVRPRATF
jgi:hypothetical protein